MSGLFAGTSLERPVTCARCERPLASCACPPTGRQPAPAIPPKDQPARVRREKRRGKVVTVIAGLRSGPTAAIPDLPSLLKHFKSTLGAGGTVGEADGGVELEIQGDHRDKVVALLTSMGYLTKAAGG